MIESIGLDMDGVIYNWYIQVKKLMCAEFGLNSHSLAHPTSWGVPWMTEEMWSWYYAHPEEVFLLGEPYANAIWGVDQLYDMTTNLTIITTARPEAEDFKVQWLKEYEVEYDRLIVEHLEFDKSEVTCAVYIDDGLHNLENVHRNRPESHTIVMDRPWNRDPLATFPRARGWRDLVAKVTTLSLEGR